MNIEHLHIPAGLKSYLLNTEYRNPKLTDNVIKKIEEIYLINKEYHHFDELQFTNVAIECAERSKSEQTFGSYLSKTMERELSLKVIQPREIYDKFSNISDDLKKADFDNFNIDIEQIDRFRALNKMYEVLEGKSESRWLYLHGNFGSGKSYLASAACNEFLRSGFSALFVYTGSILMNKDVKEYMENVECLVLDDIGITHRETWYLLDILNKRMKKPTIVTSNFNIDQLQKQYFAYKNHGDIENSTVELGKIIDYLNIMERVEMNGKNYRYEKIKNED